jgi:hypothetical protein
MAGLASLIQSLLQLTGLSTHPRAALVVVAVLAALASPWIRANLDTADARALVKRAAREGGAARAELVDRAFTRVRGQPHGLVAIADAATQLGLPDVAKRATEALRATGKLAVEQKRLDRVAAPAAPRTQIEAAMAIERLVEAGAVEAARARLRDALAKFPADEDLQALARRPELSREGQGSEPA